MLLQFMGHITIHIKNRKCDNDVDSTAPSGAEMRSKYGNMPKWITLVMLVIDVMKTTMHTVFVNLQEPSAIQYS